MLKNAEPRALMQDARAMQESALQRLDAEDWRDAAEKTWCAAHNAIKELVLEVDAWLGRRGAQPRSRWPCGTLPVGAEVSG